MFKKVLSLFLALLLCFTICACGNQGIQLNEYEQLAYECALDMKDMMKDPDSFRLYDSMWFFRSKDTDGNINAEYIIFKYGGTNSYGAVVTSEAVFLSGEYLMDFADEADPEADNYQDQLNFKFNWTMLEAYTTTLPDMVKDEIIEIDVEKVKAKMGLK